MKFPLLAIFALLCMSFTTWKTNYSQAKEEAAKNNKLILVNFAGSDWCGPCIRMHKEIFDNTGFLQFADQKLVLVMADFPRQKKNQLTKELQKQNEKLAEQFNDKGIFPLTILLNAEGKILKKWEGLPKETPEDFTNEIKAFTNVSN